jgi:hypothetical protein
VGTPGIEIADVETPWELLWRRQRRRQRQDKKYNSRWGRVMILPLSPSSNGMQRSLHAEDGKAKALNGGWQGEAGGWQGKDGRTKQEGGRRKRRRRRSGSDATFTCWSRKSLSTREILGKKKLAQSYGGGCCHFVCIGDGEEERECVC